MVGSGSSRPVPGPYGGYLGFMVNNTMSKIGRVSASWKNMQGKVRNGLIGARTRCLARGFMITPVPREGFEVQGGRWDALRADYSGSATHREYHSKSKEMKGEGMAQEILPPG